MQGAKLWEVVAVAGIGKTKEAALQLVDCCREVRMLVDVS
jgi:hypothetical protein